MKELTILVGESHTGARLVKWRRLLWALAIGAMIPIAGLDGFFLGQRREAIGNTTLPVLGRAPDYRMTNQLGETVLSSNLRGKIQLVTFLFPYCTTLCPLITAHLVNLENLGLRANGIEDKVEIVSFDVDPSHTGPLQMRAFLSQYGWNPQDPHWQYLTGPPADVRRVVQNGFGVWYKRVGLASEAQAIGSAPVEQPEVVNKLAEQAHVDYDIVHNNVLEIVDQQGRLRKIYDNADTVSWTDLLNIVQSLISRPA
jgi:cytochrome oxidase Cu insertion factor (SCO1/SenC/PrrC family)